MRKLIILILIILLSLSVIGVASALTVEVTGIPTGSFRAWLTGAEEVPPVDTDAIGLTIFATTRSTRADRALHFVLFVHNIEDVFAAHIHCAPPGVNGPIGVTLFVGDPVTPGDILARGTIRAPDPGNACGWTSMADVLAAIRSDNAYVNVHTLAHPPGEIRGQVAPLTHDH